MMREKTWYWNNGKIEVNTQFLFKVRTQNQENSQSSTLQFLYNYKSIKISIALKIQAERFWHANRKLYKR